MTTATSKVVPSTRTGDESAAVFVPGKPLTDVWAAPGLAWRAVLEKHLAGPMAHPRLRFVRHDRARVDLDNLTYPVLAVLGIAACDTIWASIVSEAEEGVYVTEAPPPPPPPSAFSVHIDRPSSGSVAGRPALPAVLESSPIGLDNPLGLALEFDAQDVVIGTLSYEGPTKSLIDDLAPLFGSSLVNGKLQGKDHRIKELRITRGHHAGAGGVTVSVWELDVRDMEHAREEEGMGTAIVRWFCDDDAGYFAWLAANPRGFVINCGREPAAGYLILHRATCSTVSGTPSRGTAWTSAYAKACDVAREELERWARGQTGASPTPCGRCHP